MGTRWGTSLAVMAMGVLMGCAAEPTGEPATAVEEIRCGNTTCALPNATATCSRGKCVIGSCFTYRGDCNHVDADGCEVALATDVNNCGGCGARCAVRPHTTATCAQGTCRYACATGYADCDGDTANGCEVNLNADNNHCGACGQRCWGTSSCCGGACVDTSYDLNHCGACGNVCASAPNGYPACYAGTCAFRCGGPYENCDGQLANGCEVDLYNDNNNCGACGNLCLGGAMCWYGNCQCPGGQALCPDMSTGVGRCLDVTSDPNNCGGCGYVCPGGGACRSGQCVCAADQTQCFNPSTSHFECRSTAIDNANCGGCDVQCAPGLTCSDGRCVAACTPCGDRCVDTALDPANCGACGRSCAAGEFCAAGACASLSQSAGYVRVAPPASVTFVDACQGRVGMLPYASNASGTARLPFDLWFWGVSIPTGSTFNVSTDGFINLDGAPAIRTGTLPDPSRPNGVIAAFAGGYFGMGVNGIITGPLGICLTTDGAAPDRRFIIEWAGAQSPFPGTLTTEIILNEASGAIDILTEAHTAPPGGIAIVGVENSDGTRAVSGCADPSALCQSPSGYRARFVPTL